MKRSDAIIIGAGIIGLSLALELRKRGLSVVVLERGEPGREASWAAAGMLSGAHDPHTPVQLHEMAEASAAMYPEFINAIEEASGKTAGFSRHGALVVSEVAVCGWDDRLVGADSIASLEPALAETAGMVYRLEEDSVDPRELMPALLAACKNVGVEVHHEHEVGGITGSEVQIKAGIFSASVIVNCAGAWAAQIHGVPVVPIEPAKGQMLALIPEHGRGIRHTIRNEEVYCVPRKDGRVAVGATVERVGFDKRVETETIQQLHQLAANLVPSLGQARIADAWAGLRPATPDGLPIIGAYDDVPGYFVATGHYRNGILLAPATAKAVSDLITNGTTSLDLSAFFPERFR